MINKGREEMMHSGLEMKSIKFLAATEKLNVMSPTS
jgi:hypothetical protein